MGDDSMDAIFTEHARARMRQRGISPRRARVNRP
jgi:hypothetical protein